MGQMDLGSYLAFQKDDLIKVLAADRATGWWYGYVITSFDQIESTARKGYFPSNYIKLLQSGDQDQKNREELQRLEQEKRQAETEKILEKARQAQTGSSSGSSYMDYVNSRFADREQLTIYHRRQESLKTERPVMSREEKHQQDVSEAYKKFGIGSKNPASMVMRRPGNRADGFKRKNKNFQDMSPCANDTRQLNYYFDYEKWNDMMNHRKPSKARPNKKRKKKKVFKL